MASLADIRAQYPEYGDMSDADLADGLYRKFYSDMPREEFDRKVGIAVEDAAPPSNLQRGFLSDDPRDWEAQSAAAGPAAKPKAHGIFVPLAEGEDGKISPALPGIIRDPVEAASKIIQRGPVHPSEVTGEMGVEGLTAAGAAMPASPRGAVSASREAIQRAHAAEEAVTKALGPRTGKSGLEQWTDADGALNIRIRPTAKEATIREASELPTPVALPRAAVGGMAEQATAGGLSSTPLGTPLIRQSQKATEQLGTNVKGVADEMGSGGVVSAGEGARDSILTWIKKELPAANSDNYAEIDKLINKNVTVPLNRTRIAAGELAAKDVESASAAGAKVVNDVRVAIQRQGMTYEGIKNLRTLIRERLDTGLEPGVSARYMQSIYSALGQDLRFAVGRSGAAGKGKQAALDAFEAANTAASEAFQKRDALMKIIGHEGKDSAEAVLERLGSMANARGGADIARLAQAKSVMGKAAWEEVGSALLNRMGETKDGFSIARWRTAYDKLSDDGKTLLFGQEHKATLDKIFRVGASAEQLAKWGNPSGTTRGAMTTAAVLGLFLHPQLVLSAAATDYGLARFLARPVAGKTASWMQRYADFALGPSNGRAQLLQQATRILAEDISAQTGADPREIEARLMPQPASQQGASGGSGGDGASDGAGEQAEAPRVRRIEDALKLPKGTRFLDPHGVERVR